MMAVAAATRTSEISIFNEKTPISALALRPAFALFLLLLF